MKNLVVALSVFLSIGSLNAQKKAAKTPVANSGPQKIAYVISDSLYNKLESTKAAQLTFQNYENEGYAELEAMQNEFQKKLAVFEQKVSGMTPLMKKMEEDELRKRSSQIEERQQSLNAQLQQISVDLNKPILERISKAIDIVSVRNKYTYVLDKKDLLFWGGGIDITAEVLVELLILDKASMVK